MRFLVLLILITATSLQAAKAPEAWVIISGNPENPYWSSFASGAEAACKNHTVHCKIQFIQDPSHIADAEVLHKAMHAKPLGISINVPSKRQLTTLLKQANANTAPLVVTSTGSKYFKELNLNNYVGPNLTTLRSLIHKHIQDPELDQTIIISRHNIPDRDHDDFVNSLFENHPNVHTLNPLEIQETLKSNPSKKIILVTFGHASAEVTEKFLEQNPKWPGKWIAVDGFKASNTANVRITTRPFLQGYQAILAITKQAQENRNEHPKQLLQEIRVEPKTI